MTVLSVRYMISLELTYTDFEFLGILVLQSKQFRLCTHLIDFYWQEKGYHSYPSSRITDVARKVSLFKEDAKRYGAINSSRSNACMRAFRFRLVGLLQHSLACFINALCCSELRRPVGQRYAISLCCFCSRYCFWTWHGFLPAHLLFGQHRGRFASLFGIESILSAHH